MVEFKVGDKVRITGVTDDYEGFNGKIGEVNSVGRFGDYEYNVSIDGDVFLAFRGSELEPAEEETSLEQRVARIEAELKENKSATGYLEQRIFKLEDDKIFAPEDGEPTKEPKRKAAEFTFGAIIRLRNDTTTYFVKTAEGWSYSRDAYLYDDEDVDNRVIAEVIREGI